MKPKWHHLPNFITYRLVWASVFALMSLLSIINHEWALSILDGCRDAYEKDKPETS